MNVLHHPTFQNRLRPKLSIPKPTPHELNREARLIGLLLRTNRHMLQLTQTEVADLVGISTAALSGIEAGDILSNALRTELVCRVYNLTFAEVQRHARQLMYNRRLRQGDSTWPAESSNSWT